MDAFIANNDLRGLINYLTSKPVIAMTDVLSDEYNEFSCMKIQILKMKSSHAGMSLQFRPKANV